MKHRFRAPALGIAVIALIFALLLDRTAIGRPLILLAQNRQENRDRVALEDDRRRAEQTKADTEFLARELAALRLAIGEVATRDYLRRELDELQRALQAGKPKKAKGAKAAAAGNGEPEISDQDN